MGQRLKQARNQAIQTIVSSNRQSVRAWTVDG